MGKLEAAARRPKETKVLIKGDEVEVTQDFECDGMNSGPLKRGQKGIITLIDDDGDAKIKFDGIREEKYVFKKNLTKLAKTASEWAWTGKGIDEMKEEDWQVRAACGNPEEGQLVSAAARIYLRNVGF